MAFTWNTLAYKIVPQKHSIVYVVYLFLRSIRVYILLFFLGGSVHTSLVSRQVSMLLLVVVWSILQNLEWSMCVFSFEMAVHNFFTYEKNHITFLWTKILSSIFIRKNSISRKWHGIYLEKMWYCYKMNMVPFFESMEHIVHAERRSI